MTAVIGTAASLAVSRSLGRPGSVSAMSDQPSTPDDGSQRAAARRARGGAARRPRGAAGGRGRARARARRDARHPHRGRAARRRAEGRAGRLADVLTACRSGVVSLACSGCSSASSFPRSSSAPSLCWPCGWAPSRARGSTSAPSSTTVPTGGPSSGACRAIATRSCASTSPTTAHRRRWWRACGAGRALSRPGAADQRGDEPLGRVICGLEVGLVAELAQRRARDRADRRQARAVERAGGGVEEARRRGAREGRPVGAQRGGRARRRSGSATVR